MTCWEWNSNRVMIDWRGFSRFLIYWVKYEFGSVTLNSGSLGNRHRQKAVIVYSWCVEINQLKEDNNTGTKRNINILQYYKCNLHIYLFGIKLLHTTSPCVVGVRNKKVLQHPPASVPPRESNLHLLRLIRTLAHCTTLVSITAVILFFWISTVLPFKLAAAARFVFRN